MCQLAAVQEQVQLRWLLLVVLYELHLVDLTVQLRRLKRLEVMQEQKQRRLHLMSLEAVQYELHLMSR